MANYSRILVTGGAGFMGSAFIRFGLKHFSHLQKIVNLDLLTYAAHLDHLKNVQGDSRYQFVRGNILHGPLIEQICREHKIEAIVHFAAETHVDRSIDDPRVFYETNVGGTVQLLEVVRRFKQIHFHHVSTDEVYGSIEEGHVSEQAPYFPNSPYAASKAASDHFVRAYFKTYGISATISHATNNYGPCQCSEKFIPRMIQSCLNKTSFPVYGQGKQKRSWLYVDDHAEAIWTILERGKAGETYNVGSEFEKENIALLYLLIEKFAHLKGEPAHFYHPYITFVTDRPGHDFRYGIDHRKITQQLGWKPKHDLDKGIAKTLLWYLFKQLDEHTETTTLKM